MTDHEYRERRKKQKLEKLFADVNLAIMVKRGEDTFDEGTSEEQQKRADELIMEGQRFIAKMFFYGGVVHEELIRELEKDYRLVGDVSLLEFSKYADIMRRVYECQDSANRRAGDVIAAQREYDEIQTQFAIAEVKLAEAKNRKSDADEKFEKVKAERVAEIRRLGLAGVAGSGVEAGADGAGDGAGADGAGDGAGADGAGDGANADGAGDGAGADGAGDGAGADGASKGGKK